MMRRAAAIAVAILVFSALAAPSAATAKEVPQSPGHGPDRVSATYSNPLDLQLPSGEQAASCADPSVIRGQTAGDTNWYLYCTSDALTENERSGTGDLVLHNVPTFQSTDLLHWTYTGDAFPTKPGWVAADGGVWAPDVVYANGRYLMYYAASETRLPGGGSAVGVATSEGPLGPWIDSGGPVVPPQDAAPGSRRWEFDPEVISAAGKTYLYFGSYFGGVFARELTSDGLSSVAATEQPISIDNRYEGTYIVQHDGWFYFLGSATNCCNGPLTGYSVFAARSRSPLGPFLDRDGVSLLDARVGGTPVLTQNGNRWVGAGHNTVITDFSGQDWTIYHAVDRNDPYYAGSVGYTKRPALLDPLDWNEGWPVVRGGQGPSDGIMPAPAAQPGQETAYRAQFVRDLKTGPRIARLSDEFGGKALSPRWTWIRQPENSEFTVGHGRLTWQTQNADLHPPALPLASVLTEPAPDGDYVVETKVSVTTPRDGCCQNFVQGGLVIYGDDGNYVKLASASIWDTRQTEFGKEISPVPAGYPNYGNTVVGPVGDYTWLRIEHRRIGGEDAYTAYTSIDGRTWDRGGTWTHQLGHDSRIGLISMGGAGFESVFDYVRVNARR